MDGWSLRCISIPLISRLLVTLVALLLAGGCASEEISRVSPGSERLAYPHDGVLLGAADLQVFRQGPRIEIVNHTAVTYSNATMWLNERFRGQVEVLPPGGSVQMSLRDFKDEFGQEFRAGGLFARYRSEPLVKAEISAPDGSGLQGMIVIPEPGL